MEIAEYENGSLARRYIPGHSVDQRVAMIENDGSDTTHFYHANRLGSVQAVVNASGVVTDKYIYTPFGVQEIFASDSDINRPSGNPFRYTGRRYDVESGLYYYRARYYDSELGRFLETDPVGYADQMNMYAYTHNDPLNFTDFSGQVAVTVGIDLDISVAGFSIGIQAKGAVSISGNFSDGFNFEKGGVGSVSTGNSNLVLKDSNASLLDKALSIGQGLIADTEVSGMAEAGAFTGSQDNPADVSDLGGDSVEIGVSVSKKSATKLLGKGIAKAVADRLPGTDVSGQLVLAENGIKGVELGAGASVGNIPVLGKGVATSIDVNKSATAIANEQPEKVTCTGSRIKKDSC